MNGDVAESLERMLRTETDRALVTILGSYIEDALLDRIMAELPAGAENRKALLKGGPLRSVEHRIALARAMGIITEEKAARLNIFRAMRNACAHSRLDITLKTPELRNALAMLTPPKMRQSIIDGSHEGTLRGIFVASASLSLLWLRGGSAADAKAYSKAAIDEDGNINADRVLLATLRGRQKSKPVPDQPQDPKDTAR
jgi:hypothetical protein